MVRILFRAEAYLDIYLVMTFRLAINNATNGREVPAPSRPPLVAPPYTHRLPTRPGRLVLVAG